MKYKILNPIDDLKNPEKGLFDDRSYFIPFSSRTAASACDPLCEVAESDRVFSLSGTWDLFTDEKGKTVDYDGDALSWTPQVVPSALKADIGYATLTKIPKLQPRKRAKKYLLRTSFEVAGEGMRHLLRFNRVGGVFEVFVNGIHCGYSALGSGEFDVTDAVQTGRNELVVVLRARVLTDLFFCGGRVKAIGILGDVLHYVCPRYSLVDHSFTGMFDSIAYVGRLKLRFTNLPGARALVTLCDGEKPLFKKEVDACGVKAIEFRDAFTPYTPDDPHLYSMYVQIFEGEEEVECTRLRVGFFDRKVTEEGYSYCGHPYKVISAFHHGNFCEQGVINAEDFTGELNVLKYCRIDAMQTDMPLEPEFLRICAEKGMLLIEDFGFAVSADVHKRALKGFGAFFLDEKAEAFVKRVCTREAMRDRTATALIGLSLLGGGTMTCFRKVAEAVSLPSVMVLFPGKTENCVAVADVTTAKEVGEAASEKPVYFSPLVESECVTGEELDEYFRAVEESKAIGGCLDEARDLTAFGRVIAQNGLLESDCSPKNTAVFCKYLRRPLRSELRENRFLDLYNVSPYASFSCNVAVKIVFDKQSKEVRRFVAHVPAHSVVTYDVAIGEIEPERKLEVTYSDDKNRVIAVEYITLQPIVFEQERIDALCCNGFRYTLRDFDEKDEENVLPVRADFTPCSSEEVCDKKVKIFADSDRVVDLSGDWFFEYVGANVPNTFSSADRRWETVMVPGSWEEYGYEPFSFVDGYAFGYVKDKDGRAMFDKSTDNTAALYRKTIEIANPDLRYHLTFENISGAAQLYVNGNYVGCTSYRFAEFDLTEHLVVGQNEIVVVLRKCSRNSFLDGGSRFVATGILGAVKLIKRGKTGLYDCSLSSYVNGGTYFVTVNATFLEVGQSAKLTVRKGKKEVFTETKEVTEPTISFDFSEKYTDANSYYGEKPVLYDLYLTVLENGRETECTKIPTALYNLRTEKGVTYMNELPLKVRGVIYNAVYNAQKRMMTDADRVRDLRIIRHYGFNAIQPTFVPSASFLRLCREQGIYVFDRIPVEAVSSSGKGKKKDVLSDGTYTDRVVKMANIEYKRTSLYGCVIGYAFTQNVSSEAIAKGCEALSGKGKLVVAGGTVGNVIGVKDASFNDLKESVTAAVDKRSVFLLSYGASYGIGCAEVPEFEKMMAGTPCCMGGMMTQFVDDVIGDVGYRDAGLFNADRKPSAGADIVKFLYRKVTSEYLLDGNTMIEIANERDFTDTSDLTLKLVLKRRGQILSKTDLQATVKPHEKRKYNIAIAKIEGDMYLDVEFYDKESGDYLYAEQHPLCEKFEPIVFSPGNKLRVDELPEYLDITFDGGTMRFDKKLGAFIRYNVMGKEILKADRLEKGGNCFISNMERPFVRSILAADKPQWTSSLRDFSWEINENGMVDIKVETTVFIDKKESYLIRDKFLVASNGRIEVFSVLDPMRKKAISPECFGKTIRLHNGFGNITYYGLGENPTYVDMCAGARKGIFSFTVDSVFDDVLRVQECDNHMNVTYVVARDKAGDGIMCITDEAPFEMRVSPISDKEIARAYLFREKLPQSGVYIDVNAFVGGYGTGGYAPDKKHVVEPKETILHFSILPLYGKR